MRRKNENDDKKNKKKEDDSSLGKIWYGLAGVAIGAGISYLYNTFNSKSTPEEKDNSNIKPKEEKENKTEENILISINEKNIEDDDSVIQSFICPITQNIMKNPVITSSGITYEKEAIEKWLDEHNTDPISGKPLNKNEIFPNYALKNAILDYLNKKENEEKKDKIEEKKEEEKEEDKK